ncbi:MAG: SDR family NAD(P)-dependent oxidoreductase [Bacteroidales bacterium]|nr:SDR family NAD(P)-dependent oxidoreductase [Bacteroidales bacterium]
MGKFTGRVVFITGSSKGIGKMTAIEMLKQGARVVINGRNESVLNGTTEELNVFRGEVMKFAGDVSDASTFGKALDAIKGRFGRLDILILNAGLSAFGAVERTSDEALMNVMKVNTFGPFTGARLAIPLIRESKGSIVLISSLAGLHGVPHSSVYSMSKMALTALAQSLKAELAGEGIHIGIIYIGFTKNDAAKTTVGPDGKLRPLQERPGWVQQSPEKVAKSILKHIRRRRFATTLSSLGMLMAFLTRYFPRLSRLIMRGMRRSAAKLTVD